MAHPAKLTQIPQALALARVHRMTLGPIQSLKQGFIGQDVGHNLSASILQIRPLRERFDFGDSFRGQPVFGTGQSKAQEGANTIRRDTR